jgi:hypothetical protein
MFVVNFSHFYYTKKYFIFTGSSVVVAFNDMKIHCLLLDIGLSNVDIKLHYLLLSSSTDY